MMSGSSTMGSMVVMKGWYRFSDSARTVYECTYQPNCVGGTNGTVAEPLCREGSSGILCSTCDSAGSETETENYYKDDTLGCLSCSTAIEGGGLTALLVVIFLVLFASLVLAALSVKYKARFKEWREANAEWLNKLSQKVIIFMIFTQVRPR